MILGPLCTPHVSQRCTPPILPLLSCPPFVVAYVAFTSPPLPLAVLFPETNGSISTETVLVTRRGVYHKRTMLRTWIPNERRAAAIGRDYLHLYVTISSIVLLAACSLMTHNCPGCSYLNSSGNTHPMLAPLEIPWMLCCSLRSRSVTKHLDVVVELSSVPTQLAVPFAVTHV